MFIGLLTYEIALCDGTYIYIVPLTHGLSIYFTLQTGYNHCNMRPHGYIITIPKGGRHMKQLHFGKSNSLYKQEGSACETMKYFLVTGMFQTVYSKGQNVAWQDLGLEGVGCTRFLHIQATLAT